jgi:hypothetical protein
MARTGSAIPRSDAVANARVLLPYGHTTFTETLHAAAMRVAVRCAFAFDRFLVKLLAPPR